MLETIRNAWKIADLRKKLLYTLGMIIIFRLGSCIPVPLLDPTQLKAMFENTNNSLFGFINLVSGGAFQNATIFAMSITPYINASIIMQLLCVAIPALERMQKEGEDGRKKIAQMERVGTVILAIIQAIGLYFMLKSYGAVTMTGFWAAIIIVVTFSAGTAFLMWLGEQITEKGIGNGISLIIFSGIVVGIPGALVKSFQLIKLGDMSLFIALALVILMVAVLIGVVFMERAQRRIPIQYAKRVVGRKVYGGQNTNLPIKVNMSGVMPVIFAQSIASLPATIFAFTSVQKGVGFWGTLRAIFDSDSWFYAFLYFILIIGFAYFYAAVQYDPMEIANNLKKNGGFIPGFRPGKPTADFIAKVIHKITFFGAIYLAIVALLPIIAGNTISGVQALGIGGTSVIIVVGVALETVQALEAQMLMRHYKGFLE